MINISNTDIIKSQIMYFHEINMLKTYESNNIDEIKDESLTQIKIESNNIDLEELMNKLQMYLMNEQCSISCKRQQH